MYTLGAGAYSSVFFSHFKPFWCWFGMELMKEYSNGYPVVFFSGEQRTPALGRARVMVAMCLQRARLLVVQMSLPQLLFNEENCIEVLEEPSTNQIR